MITLGSIATLVTRLVQNSNDGDIFKCVDNRLGIESTDYRVVRQSYHIYASDAAISAAGQLMLVQCAAPMRLSR